MSSQSLNHEKKDETIFFFTNSKGLSNISFVSFLQWSARRLNPAPGNHAGMWLTECLFVSDRSWKIEDYIHTYAREIYYRAMHQVIHFRLAFWQILLQWRHIGRSLGRSGYHRQSALWCLPITWNIINNLIRGHNLERLTFLDVLWNLWDLPQNSEGGPEFCWAALDDIWELHSHETFDETLGGVFSISAHTVKMIWQSPTPFCTSYISN